MTSMKIIADSMSHWKSQSAQAVNGLHTSLTNKE
jgi:hypothetical protein